MYDEEFMRPLFEILESLQGVSHTQKGPEYEKQWHPEGDVFIHTLQVMYHAFKETNDTDVIIAAMVHDFGKIKGSTGHEEYVREMVDDYCSEKTIWLAENHMKVRKFLDGEMRRNKRRVKFLAHHPWLPELVHLSRWDNMGRHPHWVPEYDRDKIIESLNEAVSSRFTSPLKFKEKQKDG